MNFEYDGITHLEGDAEQAALADHTVIGVREVRDDFRLTTATLPAGQAVVIDTELWDAHAVTSREVTHRGVGTNGGEPRTWTDTVQEPAPGPAPDGINPIVRLFSTLAEAQEWADREYANRLTDPVDYADPNLAIGWGDTHRVGLVWDGSRRTADLWPSQDVDRAAAAPRPGDRYHLAVIRGEKITLIDYDDRDEATLAAASAAEDVAGHLEADGAPLPRIGAERMRELAATHRQGVHRRRWVAALQRAKATRSVGRYGQIDNTALAEMLDMSIQAMGKALRAAAGRES